MDSGTIILLLLVLFLFYKTRKSTFNGDFNHHDLLFIHIPKTAGSMIETQFEKYGYPVGKNSSIKVNAPNIQCNQWHIPPKYDRSINFKKKGLITFAIVRDPLDRFISEVNYIAQNDVSFKETYRDINQFVKQKLVVGSKEYDCHLIPQSEYLVDAYGNPVENILRLESLDRDLKKFIKKYSLNINYSSERENQSDKVYGKSDLSDQSIHYIKQYYSSDYLFFSNPDNKKLFVNSVDR
jgi:hypothetical protein